LLVVAWCHLEKVVFSGLVTFKSGVLTGLQCANCGLTLVTCSNLVLGCELVVNFTALFFGWTSFFSYSLRR
jgi:hypothetical protein